MPLRIAPARAHERVVHSLSVNRRPHRLSDIDWAEVAARAKADLGDEPVERFSDRLRMTMMVAADTLRPGDTEGLRFGQSPQGA